MDMQYVAGVGALFSLRGRKAVLPQPGGNVPASRVFRSRQKRPPCRGRLRSATPIRGQAR